MTKFISNVLFLVALGYALLADIPTVIGSRDMILTRAAQFGIAWAVIAMAAVICDHADARRRGGGQ